MTSSKAIAALPGPTLFVMALAMLLNLGSMAAIAAQVARDTALIFFSGILLFVAGLAIVRIHNMWSGGWPVLVTILGWLALIGVFCGCSFQPDSRDSRHNSERT